jgi:hypothetical protein
VKTPLSVKNTHIFTVSVDEKFESEEDKLGEITGSVFVEKRSCGSAVSTMSGGFSQFI